MKQRFKKITVIASAAKQSFHAYGLLRSFFPRNDVRLTFSLLLIVSAFIACRQNQPQVSVASNNDSVGTPQPIKDPNNPKPMALMMREMALNADSMKAQLERGETLDSLTYPFIRFYLVEPTDKSVLEPQFFENARLFQEAYKALFTHREEQKKYYNLVIGKCVNCHESYCSGPLKKIRKLFVEN